MLVDYGSSDEEGKNDDKFVKPEPPSSNSTSQKSKGPVTFTVPIKAPIIKLKKDDSDDEDERPRKKLQTGTGTLSFLPAPKKYEEVENEKPKSSPKPTILKKKEQVPKPQENEEEEDAFKSVIKELAPNQVVNSPSTKKLPLSFAARNIPKEEEETVPQEEQPLEAQEAQEAPAQPYHQQPVYAQDMYAYNPEGYPQYYDPNYPYGYDYSQYYAQYAAQSQPVAPKPILNLPKGFSRDMKEMSKANMIEVRQDDFKQEMKRFQQANQDTTQEFNMFTELVKNKQHIDIMPSREGKKQHQVTYLLWEAKQKAAEIEAKRAEGIKNKKESRMRYGW